MYGVAEYAILEYCAVLAYIQPSVGQSMPSAVLTTNKAGTLLTSANA